MSSPYRNSSSYYKDSYEPSNLSGGKRFHSVSGPSSHYYDGVSNTDDRKRHRLDGSQTSSRYNSSTDYQHRSSSSFIGGKPASYYEGTSHHHRTSSSSSGHKPSSSSLQPLFRSNESTYDHRNMSSSSKYMDSASSRSRYEDMRTSKFSPPRRVPPPLGHSSGVGGYPSRSKSSASNGNLLPLMKLSVDSSSNKYSRYRQAPPEHHREGQYSYAAPSHSLHPRRSTAPISNPLTRSRYPTTSSFRGPMGSYAKPSTALTALRKATQLTAANVTSRIRKRAASARMSRDRERDPKRYHKDRTFSSTRRHEKSREKSTDSKDHEETKRIKLEGGEKSKSDEESGRDERHGDEGDAEMEHEENKSVGDKDDQSKVKDADLEGKETSRDDDESSTRKDNEIDEGNTEKKKRDKTASDKDKNDDDRTSRGKSQHSDKEDSSTTKRSRQESESVGGEKEDTGHTKALLRLNCHYCKIRCISFREFTAHLRSYGHAKSMNNAVSEMRKQLNILRSDQRDQQRKLEKSKSDKTLSDTTSYCRVCELNFRTDPTEHEKNELHNQIKTLIYQRCDVCDIDFRIWKVYLYHMAALEHAKRMAMKELQERESRGETVKGTNLSQEELGFDLVEQRTVLYCGACVRYIPIKDSEEESKTKHCMTFSHIKYVDEYNERERKYKEKKAREEERKLAAAAENIKVEDEKSTIKSEDEKNVDTDMVDSTNTNNDDGDGERSEQQETRNIDDEREQEREPAPRIKIEADVIQQSGPVDENEEDEEKEEEEENMKDDDEDETLVLHADDMDDEGDEDEGEEQSTWSRRTRSSARNKSKSDSAIN